MFSPSTSSAQPTNAPPRDPLMSLMISQPRLYIDPVTRPTAAFDPPVVRPGEETIYRVTFNALDESIEWPGFLPAPPELQLEPGAHGQMLRMSITNYEPRTTFNTRVRATRTGVFTMPEFAVQVDGKPIVVPAVRLQVTNAVPDWVPPAPQLTLDIAETNLFVGQPVQARALLPAVRGVVQGLGQPQFTGQGFLVDLAGARQHIEVFPRNGATLPTFVYETTLTPLTAGKLKVVAQGFTSGNQFSGPVVIVGPARLPGGPPDYRLLESEPVELNVRPLPSDGELPGFTGAIGSFEVGPPKVATNVVRVGEPLQLSVTITNRGPAPLARLVPPPVPQSRDWQVFNATDFRPAQPVGGAPPPGRTLSVSGPPPPGGIQGVVTFNYVLVPLDQATQGTPPIPFSCYDPKAGAYVDLTIPSVPVTVQAGIVPADLASLREAAALGGEPEKELVLSSVSTSRGRTAPSLVPPQQREWFPFLQLAPAVAFLGLVTWDRRRRYLELHPDVVLRRRARRALHRERRALRRAARVADAARFAATAVNAMRVACAPHYPAEPRALVGGDVLPLLAEADRTGRPGQVVRRFFAATDAARFGAAGATAADLLSLQPELERVLEQLEAKL